MNSQITISLIQSMVLITARKRSLRRLYFHGCLSVHRVGAEPEQVPPTPGQVSPPTQQVHPLGMYTPWQVHPPGQVPPPPSRYTLPGQVHPQQVHPPGQVYSTGQVHSLGHSACWDMLNKRAIRIPLECILVVKLANWEIYNS